MKEPARLLSGEASDFERELLGSWETEQPSDAARAKVLAMVGAGVATAAVVAKVGTAAGGSLAPSAGGAGGAALAKWLLLGAAGVVIVGGSLAYVGHARRGGSLTPAAPRTVAPATPPAASPPARVLGPAPAEAPPSPAHGGRETSPRGVLPGPAPTPRAPSGASMEKTARSSDGALGEQVAALDRARRALADGDAPAALRQLSDFGTRFPRSALVEEADSLRIEALLANNDRAAATAAGARFLVAHPGSPQAARVRALLAQAPEP